MPTKSQMIPCRFIVVALSTGECLFKIKENQASEKVSEFLRSEYRQ